MTRTKFNQELLDRICERDECSVDKTNIEKYNRDIIIEFICKCGDVCGKTFRWMYEQGGGFCKECTIKNTNEKKKQNCKKKYGCEHPSQSAEVKEKKKQTCQVNYGCANPSQSAEVKGKKKQNCKRNMDVSTHHNLQRSRRR